MKLYEYEAKKIFLSEGISVPQGKLITSPDDTNLFFPSVIKAQILTGGRGKSGGIKFVHNAAEFKTTVSGLLGSTVNGFEVKKLLVEERIDIKQEFYAGVVFNRKAAGITVIFSVRGGVEVEQTAKDFPDDIVCLEVDILDDFDVDACRGAVGRFGIEKNIASRLTEILSAMYRIFVKYDAEIVEINPLVVTATGVLVACDARVSIYDNALPRQRQRNPELFSRDDDSLCASEKEAKRSGLEYIAMDGDIGVIGNGAGLNLTTLDILEHVGCRPANFLEVSGRTYDKAEKGIEIVLKNPGVKIIFGNFFGCISRCDVIADGIASAIKNKMVPQNLPVIVAMRGNGGEEGRRILESVGVEVYDDDELAAKRVSEIMKKGVHS